MVNQVYPYTDELMRWDDTEQRYYLTEKALIQNGLDLRGRIAQSKGASPEILINRMIRMFSMEIYRYIHMFSIDNARQDYMIGCIPSLRPILYRAMIEQALFVASLGDGAMSFDENQVKMRISQHAIDELNTTLPEFGAPITYCGHLAWR